MSGDNFDPNSGQEFYSSRMDSIDNTPDLIRGVSRHDPSGEYNVPGNQLELLQALQDQNEWGNMEFDIDRDQAYRDNQEAIDGGPSLMDPLSKNQKDQMVGAGGVGALALVHERKNPVSIGSKLSRFMKKLV